MLRKIFLQTMLVCALVVSFSFSSFASFDYTAKSQEILAMSSPVDRLKTIKATLKELTSPKDRMKFMRTLFAEKKNPSKIKLISKTSISQNTSTSTVVKIQATPVADEVYSMDLTELRGFMKKDNSKSTILSQDNVVKLSNKMLVKFDDFFATFYEYDDQGRFIRKTKEDVTRIDRTNPVMSDHDWNSREEWVYMDSSNALQSITYYAFGSSLSSKQILAIYDDKNRIKEVKMINSQTGKVIAGVLFIVDTNNTIVFMQGISILGTINIIPNNVTAQQITPTLLEIFKVDFNDLWITDFSGMDPIFIIDMMGNINAQKYVKP